MLLRLDNIMLVRGGRMLVEQLDLALFPGDALQVTGPNGSGKSSLIRLAAGLLPPKRGMVDRAPLALADDGIAFDRELSLRSALRFWSASIDEAMARVGLAHLADVPVRFLSSGQLKRAALARVAASQAPLWLLDEPLNALDSQGVELLAKAIEQHRNGGGAVLAASHLPLPGEWRTLELEH